jgi:opacity protein-like surface antigen
MRKTLTVLSIAAMMVAATSSHALFGIGAGVRGGYVGLSTDADNDPAGLMIGGQVVIGFLPILDVEVAGEYQMPSTDFTAIDTLGVTRTHELDVTNLAIMVTGKIGIDLPGFFKPYIGAGLGYHSMSGTVSIDGEEQPDLDTDESDIGFHAVAGFKLEIPMFPLKPFVEGRYLSIQTEGDATNQYAGYVGVNFSF